MLNASANVPRLDPDAEVAGVLREIDLEDVEHREREDDEQHGDAEVEPRRRVDRAEGAGGEDHDQADRAVDDGHGDAVGGAEHEAAAARAGLRAGADDREVDRNHRQHARREVQREAAEEDEQQNHQRPAAFEHPALLHAVLGVVDEAQEFVGVEVAAVHAERGESVERRDAVACRRGRGRARPERRTAGGGAQAGASPLPNAIVPNSGSLLPAAWPRRPRASRSPVSVAGA